MICFISGETDQKTGWVLLNHVSTNESYILLSVGTDFTANSSALVLRLLYTAMQQIDFLNRYIILRFSLSMVLYITHPAVSTKMRTCVHATAELRQ